MLNVVANLVYANNWEDGNKVYFGDYTKDNAGKTLFAKHLIEMMDRTGLFPTEMSAEWVRKALSAFDSYHRRKAST